MRTPSRSEIVGEKIQFDKLKNIGDYLLGKVIGEGTFGLVRLGEHAKTKLKVAVKILEKAKIADMADVDRVAREIHILKGCKHPNIIELYDIIETELAIFMIMEFAAGGELFDYIVAKNRLNESEAAKFYL